MADFLLKSSCSNTSSIIRNDVCEPIIINSKIELQIVGKKSTYSLIRNKDDMILSIGYTRDIDGYSAIETISKILDSFQESQIIEIKKRLIGQYLLVIKKGTSIFVFSDFMGARNIFYSDSDFIISSSFSQLENHIGINPNDFDSNKLYEFIAMRHVLYPAWIGHNTIHKRIMWLLPFEYLKIDIPNLKFTTYSLSFSINNIKESNCTKLSDELLSILKRSINIVEVKEQQVAATLTGGHDSRLVAAIASKQFSKIKYRIAIEPKYPNTLKDCSVALKVSRCSGIPLDIRSFDENRDGPIFTELTQGFSPCYNRTVSALLTENTYDFSFGGAFGTELFMPIPSTSIDSYIKSAIQRAKTFLKVNYDFWDYFQESLQQAFRLIKQHYKLLNEEDKDYIRLFGLIDTARYSSFILAALSSSVNQLDAYGNYYMCELSLRISPKLWGNHRSFAGNSIIQKAAMAKIDVGMGRIRTYMHRRPMLPLSLISFPSYFLGFAIQGFDWLKRKATKKTQEPVQREIPGGYYISDGWEKEFINRAKNKYL